MAEKSVNLWIKVQVKEKKRSHSSSTDDAPPSKRSGWFDAQMKRMDDIQEIEKLKEKHSNDKYTPKQLHCWANLIQMKKHSSYESPPEYRYFNSKVSGGKSTASVSQASPGKRIQQRSECIDQLKKLRKLMEDGIVSEEQYHEMHKKIMADIQ